MHIFQALQVAFFLHAKDFSEKIIKELNLNETSNVVEVASNDGYLLKNFVAQYSLFRDRANKKYSRGS